MLKESAELPDSAGDATPPYPKHGATHEGGKMGCRVALACRRECKTDRQGKYTGVAIESNARVRDGRHRYSPGAGRRPRVFRSSRMSVHVRPFFLAKRSARRSRLCPLSRVLFLLRFSLFSRVGHAPDAARTIIGNVERSIVTYGYPYGPAPDLPICGDKSGKKILVLASGFAVLHGNPDNLVASAIRTIPGPVFGRESIAGVLGRESRFTGWVKGHSERGHMGLNQNIGSNDFGLKLRMRAHKSRVLMTPHIEPGPTIEAAFLN